jgi:hypothetical protein
MTRENDIVLIYYEDQPVSFARIEAIEPDIKKDWYQVKLLLLQIPLQTATWILRDVYINGGEFTMGGSRMRLEKVEVPAEAVPGPGDSQESGAGAQSSGEKEGDASGDAKVVSLLDRRTKTDK